ncbi:MAG: double-strand break repair protein AddB, partial [Paracoccaceae bacterium]
HLVGQWAAQPPSDPIILAGSTGSRGSTALLMEAVARLPQGGIVLPGFDWNMPEFGWNSLYSSPVPNEDHPQFRYARLMKSLGLKSTDVGTWHGASAPDRARNKLISLALRPAPVTDQWLEEGKALLPLDVATQAISLLEAPSPRDEALAIAVALREAAEKGERAALITPDRTLARRVAAALDQWGIRPDDSAGRPLHLSAPGRFLRHIAELMGRPLTAEHLLTLLKHPIAASSGDVRGDHLRLTRDLELKLRRYGPAYPDAAAITAWAGAQKDPAAAPWGDWLASWIGRLSNPVTDRLSARIVTLLALAESLANGPSAPGEQSQLWQAAAGEKTRELMQDLAAEADFDGQMSADAFADILTALLQQEVVRDPEASTPQIAIQGSREAREQQAELVVLAGLNEGGWPAPPAPDPWLSRQMRLAVGLLLPERQIGLAAHDFQQAAAAPRVILSRALRNDEAQTVPSRWLDRLMNLTRGLDGKDGAIADMRARGAAYLDLARSMQHVDAAAPAPRPSPRPPVAARPRELPVTAIRQLIRDPYEIYAKY